MSSDLEVSTGVGGSRAPGTVPRLTSSSHLDGGRATRRPSRSYLWYVVAHPTNLFLLGAFLLVSVVSANLWLLGLTLLAEAAVIGALPRVPLLRAGVDRQLSARERRDAAAIRAALAACMSPERRAELMELERRVETVRTNAQRASRGRGDALLDELIGLDRLLGSYTRLAVFHQATSESVEMTDRDSLLIEIRALEAELRIPRAARVREAVARRLGLARRRLESLDRNRERLLAMDHQLSAIAEMTRLVHEESVALMDAGNSAEVVERVMFELEQHELALEEIVAVCVPADPDTSAEGELALEPRAEERAVARRARVAS